MMSKNNRIDLLNTHLQNLIQLNQTNPGYDEDIKKTVDNINTELGLQDGVSLSSYSAEDLYQELLTRVNVFEVTSKHADEINVVTVTGDIDRDVYSYPGTSKILIKQE